jgi:hypothetical protein
LVDVGAQRVGGEVLFPEARRQEFHLAGGVLTDALQDIDEIVIGIDAMQAASHDEGVGDAHVVRAHLSPTEHPVFAIMHICA